MVQRPTGVTVNIGDSRTNNGFSGDGATQSNDAEIEIGFPLNLTSPVFNDDTLGIHGNDIFPGTPPAPGEAPVLIPVIDFVNDSPVVNLTVADQFFAWDNNAGVSGSLNSPFLYALNGQPDSEGPVNYDIFAGFNRVISSNSRIGAGVGEVTICLRTSDEDGCFATVPAPTTLSLLAVGLAALGFARREIRW